jgi:pimeloyl-ACP methyl ester carboxylesterase
VFDKRGVGQSTGDWKTSSFQDLAEDYIAAVRFLQMQSGVNARKVGIYGHSQGATLSPLIASRPGAVAFVIAAAAIGTGPIYEQDLYRTRNELIDSGLTERDVYRAMELYGRWLTVARTGEGWAALDQAIRQSENEKWLPGLGLPPKDHWLYKWYPPIGNFNPLPFWEKVTVPVLLVYGELDRNTPVAPSLTGIGEALRKANNVDFTPIVIPRATHDLTIKWERDRPFFWWHVAPGYADLLAAWVKLRFSGEN